MSNCIKKRTSSGLCLLLTCLIAASLLLGVAFWDGSGKSIQAAGGRTVKKIGIPPVDFERADATSHVRSPRVAADVTAIDVFNLHSRPSATKVIYLDFDGHVTNDTLWNQYTQNQPIVTTAFDIDGTPGSFDQQEEEAICEIWQRTAECYSPFDVDVTTAEPSLADLINSGGVDTRWGIRVLFGETSPSPAPGAGGVAFLNSFSWNATNGQDTPCFVFQSGVETFPKYNADAAIHEVGHTLGLSHDGRTFPRESYYEGQGRGLTAWAPHMGVGYYVSFVQWSEGEYARANNIEDDLQIITTQNGFGYRTDDFSNLPASAQAIPGSSGGPVFDVDVMGVIEREIDTDWFLISSQSGEVELSAVGGPANSMLDIQLSLYTSNGILVATSNPVDRIEASLSTIVSTGTYYLKIEGVGKGNPSQNGYSKYSSIGQYQITGTYPLASQSLVESLTNKVKKAVLEALPLSLPEE